MPRIFTPEQDRVVADAYKAGTSVVALSERFTCSKDAIMTAIRRCGRTLKGRKLLSDKQDETICREYLAGKSTTELAEEIGVSVGTIAKAVRKFNC